MPFDIHRSVQTRSEDDDDRRESRTGCGLFANGLDRSSHSRFRSVLSPATGWMLGSATTAVVEGTGDNVACVTVREMTSNRVIDSPELNWRRI